MLGSSGSGMELRVYSFAFLLLICFFPITGTASESDENFACGPKLETNSGTAAQSELNFFACGPGLKTKGVTIPKGDIVVEYGSPLEIKCLLNPETKENYNSSSLVFVHNEIEVPSEFVSIINETAIRLYIEKPPPSSTAYKCRLRTHENKNEGVCVNMVFVGYPPIKVKNFKCKSLNWQSLNCSWVPVHNNVKTCYRLYYYEKSKKKQYNCPGGTDFHSESRNYCFWNSSSDPIYRNALEKFYFYMEERNALGKILSSYEVDHYSIVVPNKASNLNLVNATPSSLCISWSHPIEMRYFPPGLVSKVMYQSKWDSLNDWQLVNTSHLNVKQENQIMLNITGLKYAHTVYDIRVLLKSASAKDELEWWSEPATITLRTKATVPGMSPKTDIGSFETHDVVDFMRDIYIYWQQIPRHEENGDGFEYKVIRVEEYVNGKRLERNIAPRTITKTYAKFTNLTHNSYKFSIVSSNKEGYSSDKSVVIVPSRTHKLPEPLSFTKVAYNHGVYELSWSHPNDISIKSYTIFWCENKHDRPFDCQGYLDWKNVGNVTERNVTLPEDKTYQFAISANSEKTSSGMLWAKCTVLPDQARGKLKHTSINRTGATFIEVGWKLDCFERVRIRGFVISFCPVVAPQNTSCKEPMRNKTIKGEAVTHGNITELKPYTTYKIVVAVQTSTWLGMSSDASLITTLEAAPDMSPGNIRELGVTNTSISLSWSPPLSLNGVLRHYMVYFNNNMTKIKDTSNTVIANLTGLNSYEWYNITISACTVKCSPESPVLRVKTKIGSPSQLPAPQVKFNSTENVYVTWSTPRIPGGPVNYYRVKLEKSEDGENFSIDKYITTNQTSYKIETSDCKVVGPSIYYRVYVRAVNLGDNGKEEFSGPWSPAGEDNCYSPSAGLGVPTMVLIALVGVLALIVTCFAVAFVIRCAWLRFKAMQNVGVKLPPQLELNSVFKDKSVMDLPINAHVCSASLKPHQLPVELLDESTTPDQQLLLDNKLKDEGSCDSPCDELDMALETGSGEGHIESSGCGSGHDSVSSSITAGTHITDSGTEADERPASPDVFSQSPRRLSDLRQRNITGGVSGGGGGSGEGYSRLAAAPTGYVTLPQGPRSYVSHTHLWPHNGSVQQYHKGYVIAPPPMSTYSKVSLLPPAGLKIASSREHCADTESGARSDGQLSINPASSI